MPQVSRGSAADGATPSRRDVRRFLETARKRFDRVVRAESRQRAREREDLQFARGWVEDHWPEEVRRLRAGGIGPDGRLIAERPTLVIDKLAQPVQSVINEARRAKLAIQIKPKSDGATAEGAELRQGLIRAIEVESNAQAVRLGALERAVKCGRGYYRILTQYNNDGDFDLDIRIARIRHQGSVYLDPDAQELDGSDAEFAFIVEDVPRDRFKARYGVAPPEPGEDVEFASETDTEVQWVGEDYVRVAEYFWVEHQTKTLIDDPALPVPGPVFKEDLPPEVEVPPTVKQRKVDVRQVKWALITATQVLDEADWPGRYIPIIPVVGIEQDVDGRELCFQGMITKAKDSQRAYNYMRSAEIEAVGLAPRAPWIMAEGQDEGYEQMWNEANIRNFTRLIYKPTTFAGELVPPPQRNVAEPAIQAISLATRQAEADIKATTGRWDPSLGAVSADRSGRAIEALKQQGELSSSNYLENLANISMIHEGRILLDLLPKVYDRPGRIVRLLGDDLEFERQVLLHVPFRETPQGPVPVPLPPPAGGPPPHVTSPVPAGGGPLSGGAPGAPPPIKRYTLDDGEYACVVVVGQAHATQREQNLALLQSLIEVTKGGIAPLVIDLLAEQLEGPMGRKLAQRFRRLNPQLQDQADSAVPPHIQQQLQQLQQQLAEAQQIIQTEQHKAQARAQVEMAKAQAQAQMEQQRAAWQAELEKAKLQMQQEVAKAKAELEVQRARLEAEVKKQLQDDQQAHEVALRELELRIQTASREKIEKMRLQAEARRLEQEARLKAEERAQQLALEERKLAMQQEVERERLQIEQQRAAQRPVRTVQRDERGLITAIEG